MTVTRLLSVDDAEEMLAVIAANREFLGNSGPQRTEDFFTVQAQRADLERALEAHAREVMVPLAIVDEQGQLIGRININNITRGAAQSATVGYWVSQSHNGRGFASAARWPTSSRSASSSFACTDCRRIPGWETRPPSACSPATGFSRSPSLRHTSR